MTDYLAVNVSNTTTDDYMLKNLMEYYIENFHNISEIDEDEEDQSVVLNIETLNLHQYVLLGL